MGHMILATADWSDAGTLTAGNELATAPGTNLQSVQPTTFWRSSGLTSLVITVNRGSSQPLNFIALLYTNANAACSWRVKASDSASFPGDPGDYDSGGQVFQASPLLTGLPADQRHGFLVIDSTSMVYGAEGWALDGGTGLSRQYAEITITNPTNPDGYFQAGRLIIGQAYRPTVNFAYGGSVFGLLDPGKITETVAGNRFGRPSTLRKVVDFTLPDLPLAEARMSLPAFLRTAADERHALAVFEPEESTYAEQELVYGTIQQRTSLVAPAFGLLEVRLTMEELI